MFHLGTRIFKSFANHFQTPSFQIQIIFWILKYEILNYEVIGIQSTTYSYVYLKNIQVLCTHTELNFISTTYIQWCKVVNNCVHQFISSSKTFNRLCIFLLSKFRANSIGLKWAKTCTLHHFLYGL